MKLLSWLRNARSSTSSISPTPHNRRAQRFRPRVEGLEDRSVPATTLVNTFADVVDPNDGLNSLREAIALAADPATHAGDDIIVLPHEIGGVAGTYALSLGQLFVNDLSGKLTIMSDGGAATVDAKGASRAFFLSDGNDVALQGLTITGGFDLFGGGGIINYGSLTITDTTLSGNSAFYYGGGIFNLGAATITDSTLIGNSAAYGGGINNFFSTATVTVTSSILSGNSAVYDGGGIWNNDSATVAVSASKLDGNSAAYGGGIYSLGETTITDSAFSGNKAILHDGGGIWNGDLATLNVTASKFDGNSAGFGAAIYNHGTATVADSTLSNNSADYGGAALNFGTGNFSFTGSTLDTNSAVYNGGGIWNYETATIALNDCTLKANSAVYGGGIFSNGTATIANTTFSGNKAILHDGGGIWNGDLATLNVTASKLDGNSAGFGAAIYNHGVATVADSTLSNNSADYGGAALNFGTGIFSFTGSTFDTNSALNNGGAIWNYETATIALNDCTLKDNSADYGGGIYSFGKATITDSAFSGNKAILHDGGGFWNGGNATLTITGSTLSGNSTGFAANGGGIWNGEWSTLNVIDSTFSGNSAYYGGGIENRGVATVAGSTFSLNSATFGGGIHSNNDISNGATLTVTDCTFSGNKASGGGISNGDTLTVADSTFSDNEGGGLQNLGMATVAGSTFSGNTGSLGAGIVNGAGLSNGITLSLTDSSVSNNTGPGIYSTALISVTGSGVSGNTAEGIYLEGVIGAQLLGNTITGNSKSGVRISNDYYYDVGKNNIIGSPLSGNTIAFNGGAGVAVAGSSTGIAIRGNSIYGNAGPGIDLGNDGLTANDLGDADDGPNHLQNLPVLVLASSDGASVTISGLLNSTANTRFLIDFYAIPSNGIGMAYLGAAQVLTNGSGYVDFEVTLPSFVPAGWGVTATATTIDVAPFGDTSEFALGIPVFKANQPPVIGNQTFGINENSGNGTVVGTVVASDPDAGQTLTYQITAGNGSGAFAVNSSTGQITVANSAALDFETTPTFSLTVQVTDNGSPVLSSTASMTINLNNINEAPVNSVPTVPQAVAKNKPLVFSSANGNAISVSDPDSSTGLIQVSLTVLHGKLTLGATAGLTFQVGDGKSDRTMTFRGTIAAINAALDGLTYLPNKGYVGSDSLTMVTNDLGSGLGNPLSDTDVVSLLVADKK